MADLLLLVVISFLTWKDANLFFPYHVHLETCSLILELLNLFVPI